MSTTYQVDVAMLGGQWDGNIREFAADLQQEVAARGWDIQIETVNTYNGAKNTDEEGYNLEESFPREFDEVFWLVAGRHIENEK